MNWIVRLFFTIMILFICVCGFFIYEEVKLTKEVIKAIDYTSCYRTGKFSFNEMIFNCIKKDKWDVIVEENVIQYNFKVGEVIDSRIPLGSEGE